MEKMGQVFVLVCAAAGVLRFADWAHGFPGQSLGRWRVPSTVSQYWGFGHGPGYHAPIVRYRGYQPAPIPRLALGREPSIPFTYPEPLLPYCSEGLCGGQYQAGGFRGIWGAASASSPYHSSNLTPSTTAGVGTATPPATRPEQLFAPPGEPSTAGDPPRSP